mgnify:FL=1
MEAIIEGLAQYGPLGLWTASLLWMNWQQRKDKKEEDKAAKEARQYHQEMIVSKLTTQEKMLAQALEKIDRGLGDMRAKYAEDRLLRMQGKGKE